MHRRRAIRRSAAALVPLLALALGCATLGGALEPPEVFLVDFEPLAGGNFERRFRVDLRLENPNDSALEIDGLDFELHVNGVRLTRGLSSDRVTIPRLGEERVSVVATTTLLDLLRQVMAGAEQGGLRWELQGRVFLANSSRRLDFSKAGDLLR